MALLPEYEHELLLRVSKGDQVAFARLFETYHQRLGAFIYGITKSREVTEEIVLDAFLKIWMSREALVGINSFKAYLFVIARNAAISALRKIMADRDKQSRLQKELVSNSANDVETESKEYYLSIIDQAIHQLSPQRRKIFLLSRESGMKYEDIAKQIGISKLTVRAHIQQAVTSITQFVRDKITHEMLFIWFIPTFF